jgi:hypothetical protein
MTTDRRAELRSLEGRQVSICLEGGARLDDCQLVSAGGHGVESLWLFASGGDAFVPIEDVVELWEVATTSRCRAAA